MLTLIAFQALMVTIRLTRAAISSWLNSAATSWYACAGTWVSASSVTASGFAQGLALLCQVLRERGARTIAMEASGHPGHRHCAEAHGLRPVALARPWPVTRACSRRR